MSASAPTVAAALRRAGFAPCNDRKREGVRVLRSALAGRVNVRVDFDSRSAAAVALADDIEAALRALGYRVTRTDSTAVAVTR